MQSCPNTTHSFVNEETVRTCIANCSDGDTYMGLGIAILLFPRAHRDGETATS